MSDLKVIFLCLTTVGAALHPHTSCSFSFSSLCSEREVVEGWVKVAICMTWLATATDIEVCPREV
jgi:hypothetical protein